jgi:hypothetical protein
VAGSGTDFVSAATAAALDAPARARNNRLFETFMMTSSVESAD